MRLNDVLALDITTYTDLRLWDTMVDVLKGSFSELEKTPHKKVLRDLQGDKESKALLLTNSRMHGLGAVFFQAIDGNPFCTNMFNFCVTPEHRGQGYGRRLAELGEHHARSFGFKAICLETEPYTAGFYEAIGYSTCSETLPMNGRNLVIMEKDL